MRRTAHAAALLAVVTLALAACGTADDDAATDNAQRTTDLDSDVTQTSEPNTDRSTSTTSVTSAPSTTSSTSSSTTTTSATLVADTSTDVAADDPTAATDVSVSLCEDVTELVSDVRGNVGDATNPDDAFIELARTYGMGNPKTFGGIWIDRNAGGTVVVGFTDDPEPHRDRIAALTLDDLDDLDDRDDVGSEQPLFGGQPGPVSEWVDVAWDVMRVQYVDAEIPELIAEVAEDARQSSVEVVSSSYVITIQRITLGLAEPTADALVELADFVDPQLVCVEGPLLDPDRRIYEPGDEIDIIVRPDAEGNYPAGLRVGCVSTYGFPLNNALDPTFLVEAGRDDLLAGIESAAAEFGIDLGVVDAARDGWILLEEVDDTALMYNGGIDAPVAMVVLRTTDAGWTFGGSSSGGGNCELRVAQADGLGGVEWMVDPDVPLDPNSSTIDVLATEQACTGSREMGDQLLGPQVIETDTEVLIAFASIPLRGPQTCPGNPSTPVTVGLDAPLGDRTVRDGRSTGFTLEELLAR